MDPLFAVYKQFNDSKLEHFASMKHRIHSLPAELFPSDDLPDRLARSLVKHRAIHIKELLEAFEFFAKVRKRVRRPTMIDLCAGHGLVGLIFALCEPGVLEVKLIDERQPPSFSRIFQAFVEIAPWVEDKVTYYERCLNEPLGIDKHSGLLLVHACGSLTDEGLKIAEDAGVPVAAMPCCYGKAHPAKVPSLSREFGRETNIDISRSYRMANSGYQVDWSAIPRAITPMNRIIVAWGR